MKILHTKYTNIIFKVLLKGKEHVTFNLKFISCMKEIWLFLVSALLVSVTDYKERSTCILSKKSEENNLSTHAEESSDMLV